MTPTRKPAFRRNAGLRMDFLLLSPTLLPRLVSGTPIALAEDERGGSDMRWNECYEKVQLLSPKAAKLASRMLRKDPLVPSNWGFALEVALTVRAHGVGALTSADLEAIAASQRDEGTPAPSTLDEDQREAWAFAASVRAFAVRDSGGVGQRPHPAPEGPAWDPRTPTPDEAWLLAFSEELRRLADGKIDPDEIARCAIERLETDGHRSPLAVAREQFIAAPVR
jgi:hypothetical protein